MHLCETAPARMCFVRIAATGALMLSALSGAAPAWSQDTASQIQVYSFDIEAGPLAPALTRLALVTGHQLLAESRLVAGLSAPALRGEYTAEEALQRLLAESGLAFEVVDARTFVVTGPLPTNAPRVDGIASTAANGQAAEDGLRGRVITGLSGTEAVRLHEVITVTGSRFADSNRRSVTPLQVIGREDLRRTGATDIGEIIAFQSPATLEFSSASTHLSAQNAGLTSLALRGLGTTRTLVLIDGRRTVSNSGNATRFGADTLPPEFVERVEISTGGASAVYGSDAVAGVVNFVLLDAVEGGSLLVRSGVTQDGGGQQTAISLTQGWSLAGGRGRLLLNLMHDTTRRIGAEDRDWSLEAVALTADGESLEGDLSSYPLGGRFLGNDFWYDEAGLQTGFSTEIDGYDSRREATIAIPRDRDMLALKADFDLVPGLTANLTTLFSRSDSLSLREPQTAYYNQRFGLADERIGAIPVDHPLVPDEIRAAALSEGQTSITWRRRFGEFGPEYRQIDRQTLRSWAGLSGEAGLWQWEASLGYGRYAHDQLRSGEVNHAHLKAALDIEADPSAPGTFRCTDPQAREAGCRPVDLFGVNSIDPAAIDYIRATDTLQVDVEQWTLGGVLTGEVPVFPDRALPLVIGFEHRIDRQRTLGDPAAQRLETGYVSIPDFDATARTSEAFLETRLPLIEDRPGIRRLDLSAAYRLAHYDIDAVGLVGSYRVGLSWEVDESLAWRAQLARAQRAPGLIELYSGERGDFDSISDPCHGVTASAVGVLAENCRADPGIAAAITGSGIFEQQVSSVYAPNAGNPDLEEERSDAVTLGVIWTPAFLDGLSVALDLYDIQVSGAISSLSSQSLIEECYNAPITPAMNPDCLDVVRSSSGQLQSLVNRVENLNALQSSGADLTLDYRWRVGPSQALAGDWSLRVLYAFNGRLEQRFERYDGVVRRAVWDGEVGSPHHRWMARLGWARDQWQWQWRVRYEGEAVDSHARAGAANAGDLLFVNVDAWLQHDLYAERALDPDGRIRAFGGIDNVFHDYGPFLPSGTASGDRRNFSSYYDAVGRRFYLGLRASW